MGGVHDAPQEAGRGVAIYGDDLGSDEAMRVAMHFDGELCTGCIYQAVEDKGCRALIIRVARTASRCLVDANHGRFTAMTRLVGDRDPRGSGARPLAGRQ